MRKIITLLLCSYICLFFPLRGYAEVTGMEALNEVSKKYGEHAVVVMYVDKIVTSELLGKETKYLGKIYFSSGKIRWEIKSPEKSLLVFDGTTLWSEQSPSAELGGPVQVARGKIDKKNKSQMLLPNLLGQNASKNFKVIKETKKGSQIKLSLESIAGSLDVNSIEVLLNPQDKILDEVSYKDDIGNKTSLHFSKVKFFDNHLKNVFKYKIPKGAQVTDL